MLNGIIINGKDPEDLRKEFERALQNANWTLTKDNTWISEITSETTIELALNYVDHEDGAPLKNWEFFREMDLYINNSQGKTVGYLNIILKDVTEISFAHKAINIMFNNGAFTSFGDVLI